MEIIQVFLLNMPSKIDALTVKNEDGSFTILINAGLSALAQCRAYDHEIEHINNHDYDYIYDVGKLELLRNSA